MRFGKWDFMQNNSLYGSTIAILFMFQKAVMLNGEAITIKKMVQRKEYPRVVNVLKISIGVTTITKRILDLHINLTIDELLALAPAIEKQLTKTILEDEAVYFWFNILESSKAIETKKLYSCYSMNFLKAKVRLEKGSKVTALLNTVVEINVMTGEIMEDA